MEYMGAVFVYVNAVDALSITTSADMAVAVYDKTFPTVLMSTVGKHASIQAGSHYEIIVLFHDFLFFSSANTS